MKLSSFSVCTAILFCLSLRKVSALHCYSCDSTAEVSTCGEQLATGHTLEPIDCSEHLQGPQYCVKKTGLFEGVIGTKRFCSARDFGQYCEWVMRPGDEREYRACVYTCSGNGCNHARAVAPSAWATAALLAATAAFRLL